MLIFVSNIPVYVVEKPQTKQYSNIIDLKNDIVKFNELADTVLIRNATSKNIVSYIEFLQINGSNVLKEVVFLVENKVAFKRFIKKELDFVKAAGGLVEKHDGKVLFMKRLGVWDLPKGKAEIGEKSEITALREVEEECNITVYINHKIISTWHTYFHKGKLVIKRTKWYAMGLVSDSKMKPQHEEGIEELKWMDKHEMEEAIKNSYGSIVYVVENWLVR